MTLMVSLGMLVDRRPAHARSGAWPTCRRRKIAERLDKPMLIGFIDDVHHRHPAVLRDSGAHHAEPVVSHQDDPAGRGGDQRVAVPRLPDRGQGSWDLDPVPPRRTRVAAGLSLALWAGVVITGRFIAYDWFDCGDDNPAFVDWAAGCVAGTVAESHAAVLFRVAGSIRRSAYSSRTRRRRSRSSKGFT